MQLRELDAAVIVATRATGCLVLDLSEPPKVCTVVDMRNRKHYDLKDVRDKLIPQPHGWKIAELRLNDGDTAWQPGTDSLIGGPARVIYSVHPTTIRVDVLDIDTEERTV
jgi:hypothetical protein